MPFRCGERACGHKRFSVRTGTVMEYSKIGYQDRMLAMFLVMTNLKGVSSMKLHGDREVNLRSAWFLAHRLRLALTERVGPFSGLVEVDETYMGRKRRNMSNAQPKELEGTGRGALGKTAVVGARGRETNQVAAKVVESAEKEALQGFVSDHAESDVTVYTDDASAYETLPFDHDTVRHSLQEYVKGDVHTKGIESLWSMLSPQGHLPQVEPEASGPLRAGVRRTPQCA